MLLIGFCSGFVTFSSLYYLPQFFQVGLGFSPIKAGLFLVPVMVSQMVASWVTVSLVALEPFPLVSPFKLPRELSSVAQADIV